MAGSNLLGHQNEPDVIQPKRVVEESKMPDNIHVSFAYHVGEQPGQSSLGMIPRNEPPVIKPKGIKRNFDEHLSTSSFNDEPMGNSRTPEDKPSMQYNQLQMTFQKQLEIKSNTTMMAGDGLSQATNQKRFKLDDQQQQVQSVYAPQEMPTGLSRAQRSQLSKNNANDNYTVTLSPQQQKKGKKSAKKQRQREEDERKRSI